MYRVEKYADTIIIYLPEEVDDYQALDILDGTEDVFADAGVRNVVFDFRDTMFMDSSGIGLMTRRFRDVYDRGGKMSVVNVNSRMDKILRMSGIYKIANKWEVK